VCPLFYTDFISKCSHKIKYCSDFHENQGKIPGKIRGKSQHPKVGFGSTFLKKFTAYNVGDYRVYLFAAKNVS
jgi:hypothetical protein